MTATKTPQIIEKTLTRRLPQTVKSKHRVFLYDNSCNMHKHALRRGAKEILRPEILRPVFGHGRLGHPHSLEYFSSSFSLRLLLLTLFGESPVRENLFPPIFWQYFGNILA